MISFFRKNKRGIVGTLMVGMCVVLMLPFGLDYFGNSSSLSKASVAKVGSDEISAISYDRSLYQFQSMLKKQFGDNYEKISSIINVKQKVLDDLINKKILEEVLKKANFEVGVSHVESYIRSLPVFGGDVSRERLIGFLKSQGMSEQQFQSEIEDAIKFDQLEKIFSLAASYSPSELEKRFTKNNQKIVISYAKVHSPKELVEVTLDEISSYYEAHKDEFKTDKSFNIHVLKLPFSVFESKVVTTEEDYQDAYKRYKKEFVIPQKAQVEILSFQKKAPDFLETEGSPKIDFEQLAKATQEEVSKEPAKFKEIGQGKGATYRNDTSLMEVGHLPKEVQSKLSRIPVNGISEVIETAGDFSIVKLNAFQEESLKPLESVKSELEKSIKKDIAPEFALVKADQLKNEISSIDKSKVFDELQSIRDKENFELKALQGTALTLPPEISEVVRSKSEGDIITLQSDSSIELVFIESVKDPEQKSLQDVSAEIKKMISQNKRHEQSKKLAKEILVSAKNVGTFVTFQGFKELIKKYNLEMSDIEGKLGNVNIPFLAPDKNTNKVISEVVMNGTHSNPVEGVDGEVYIFVLKEIAEGEAQPTQEAKKTFLAEQETLVAQRLEKILTENLKSKKTITVNDEIIDRF